MAERPDDALHRQGVALFSQGRLDEAVAAVGSAVAMSPRTAIYRNTLGALLLEARRLDEAIAALGEALAIDPAYFEARYNLANAYRAAGDPGRAEESYRAALRLRGDSPDALNNLGMLLVQQGRRHEAEGFLRRALEVRPGFAQALANLARLKLLENDTQAAAQLAGEALAGEPALASAHATRILALRALDRDEESVAAIASADAAQPQSPEVLAAAAEALEAMERPREALSFRRRASAREPASSAAAIACGLAELRCGHVDRAIEVLERAWRGAAPSARTALPLAAAYGRLQRHGDAADVLEAAREDAGADLAFWAQLAFSRLRTARWDGLDEAIATTRGRIESHPGETMLPGLSLLLPGITPQEQRRIAERWAARMYPPRAPVAKVAARGSRLRLGYLSADFCAHATAHLIAEVLEHHDRGTVEVFAFSHGADDGSRQRSRVQAACEHFVEIAALDDAAAAREIAARGIDVLVDLKGYTEESRIGILSRRPAPVQVSFLGYPGTTGAPFIDGIVADDVVIPERLEAGYSERVLRMPVCYQPNPARAAAPPAESRAAHGLPEQGAVLCCFNAVFKITPDAFARWCRLLERVPGSVLWLLEPAVEAQRNLRAKAAALRVDAARIVFAPSLPVERHLARIALADVALDTSPYNSHTTASDAIRAGVPLVTVPGESFADRVAASVVRAARAPELACDDAPAADRVAEAIARDPKLRGALGRKLAESDLPLFDAARFAAEFEALMAGAARR